MPLFSLTDQVSVVQIRAQWGYTAYASGESSWSFILPRAGANQQLVVLTAWQNYLENLFRAARPSNWFLDTVRAEDRWPATHAPLIVETNLPGIPEEFGTGLPPQCTPVISWRTGNEGRQNRGRTYMGPYTSDSCEESNIVDPALSAVYDFAEAMQAHFMGSVIPATPRFAIVSKIPSDPDWPAGHYTLPETYYFLERWAVMRRRLDYDWRT